MTTRGAITLVFDDGYEDVHNEVLPMLQQYGIQAVFAIPLAVQDQVIAGEKVASISAWQEAARANGHELASHGVTHHNLADMPVANMRQELRESYEKLHATSIVYPGGAYSHDVVQEAKKYFSAGRTVNFGLETLPPQLPLALKTINYTKKNFSVARANTYALLAYMQDRWLIETFHMVRNQHSDMKHFVYLKDLETHLDFIASLPIRIATMRQIMDHYAK